MTRPVHKSDRVNDTVSKVVHLLDGVDPHSVLASLKEPENRDMRVDLRVTPTEWAIVQRLAAYAKVSTTTLLVGLAKGVDEKVFPGRPPNPTDYPRKTDPRLRRKRGKPPSEIKP